MRITLRELVESGRIGADTVAMLHGAASLAVVQALLEVQRAAAKKLTEDLIKRPCMDVNDPPRHVLTVTGELGATDWTREWIEEATEIVTGGEEK